MARRGMMKDIIRPEFEFEDALEFESKRDECKGQSTSGIVSFVVLE